MDTYLVTADGEVKKTMPPDGEEKQSPHELRDMAIAAILETETELAQRLATVLFSNFRCPASNSQNHIRTCIASCLSLLTIDTGLHRRTYHILSILCAGPTQPTYNKEIKDHTKRLKPDKFIANFGINPHFNAVNIYKGKDLCARIITRKIVDKKYGLSYKVTDIIGFKMENELPKEYLKNVPHVYLSEYDKDLLLLFTEDNKVGYKIRKGCVYPIKDFEMFMSKLKESNERLSTIIENFKEQSAQQEWFGETTIRF